MSKILIPDMGRTSVRRLKWFTWTLVVCWTILVAASLLYQLSRLQEEAIGFARAAARYSLKKDMIYWRILPEEGVYFPSKIVNIDTFLTDFPESTLATPSGRKLTLVNPATILRSALAMGEESGGAGGRLTSLKPIRQESTPDEWETKALQDINKTGKRLLDSIDTIDGKPYLRFMQGFVMKESCLRCHAAQGHKKGDIFGGISAAIPLDRFQAGGEQRIAPIILTHGLLWTVGTITMLVGGARLRRGVEEQNQVEASLRRNMEELALAEARARESETRFRLAMDASNEGIWDWHVPSNTTYRSPNCYAMLGYQPGEIGEKPENWEELVHPDDHIARCKELDDILAGKQANYEFEYRMRTKSGEWRWIHTQGRTVEWDNEGRPVRRVGTHIDITERKLAEARQDELEGNLRQAQKMEAIGTLATGIAHDFNNLLTAIGGYADLAKEQVPNDHPAQHTLAIVSKAVEDGSGIATSLLTFSRKAPAAKHPVAICKVIQESVKLLCRLLPASVQVCEEYDGIDMLYVYADTGQLHQVMMNLIANARDAMPEGGTLRIRVTPEVRQEDSRHLCGALLMVEDTGVGMTPEVASKAFDPFFTTKTRGRGTGLGLAMVHGIVQNHDGKIDVQSKPGGGTRVEIRLPCCSPPIQPETQQTAVTPHALQNRIVLLAEDNPFVRAIIVQAMRTSGCSVIETASGVEALERFQANVGIIDALVLDIDLPERSGLQCRKEIRKAHSDLPILMITGSSGFSFDDTGDAYSKLLLKPFKMSELVQAIESLITAREKDRTS